VQLGSRRLHREFECPPVHNLSKLEFPF
jgi:hypothetical protein